MSEGSHRAEEGRRGSKARRCDPERDRQSGEGAWKEPDRERHPCLVARAPGKSEGKCCIFHLVGREGHGPLAGTTPRCEHRHRNVCGSERRVVRIGVAEDRDHMTTFAERPHRRAAIRRENFGANVIDVEGASDRLARVARLAAEENRLDPGVEKPLHGGPCTRAEAVLEGYEADQLTAEGSEENTPTFGFEGGGARIG